MKKICYVVTLPVTIKAFFIPQLKYLSENEFDISVICNDDMNLQSELGNKIKYIPIEIPRGISFFNSIKTIKELINIFKREQYDLIQYSTPNAALYSAIAAKSAGCSIRNYHCMGFRYLGFSGIPKIIFKAIEKLTCSLSSHIECVSPSNLELGVNEKIFDREKAIVVFHGSTGGVDLNRFNFDYRDKWREELRNKYDILENDFVYGFVGRITKDKGIDELFSAYKVIEKTVSNTKLVLIGLLENVELLNPELLSYARYNENILFVGNVDDIEKYYPMLDVLVLPSYREGFGNVVIEAEAMGTPVIVSNIPGPIDTMVNEKTGVWVDVKDVNNLSEKMLILNDRELVFEYSKNAVKYVKNYFDSDLLCQKILERKINLLQGDE